MALNGDWIFLHYHKKPGITHVESKILGDKMVELINAEYLGEIKTDIGTFYRYRVNDLEVAYRIQRQLVQLCE